MKLIRHLITILLLALAANATALEFNYSTRLTLTDCDSADEAAFKSGTTTLCYDLTAQREEIWNGTAWVVYAGSGSSSTSPAYVVGGYTSGTCTDDGDVDTLETICEVTVSGYNAITFQGTVATAAFSDFNIDFSNDGTNYVNYYTATADYTPVCSADPTTWSSTHILCRINGLAGIQKVMLQAAGTNSDPTITYQVQ